jgi:hypothetical protein
MLLAAIPALAQIDQCTRYRELIDAVVAGKDPRAAETLMDLTQAPRCFALFVADLDRADRAAFKDFVRRFEGRRADKQAGTASGEGSTSVVSQGPVAKILSLAAEYGALTQSVSGQVVTLRGNLAGVPSLLVNQDVFPYCVGEEAKRGYCIDRSLLGVLKRLSFGVSFDASRNQVLTADASAEPSAAPTPVTFTAESREISALSARVELWNRRDASSPQFAAAWRDQVGAAMDAASADLLRASEFVVEVTDLPDHNAWFQTSVAAIRAAGRDRAKVVAALSSALNLIATQARAIPGFEERVRDALAAYSRFFLAQDELIDVLARKNVLAFEYTNVRPSLEPARSNYRVIFDYAISAETKVVANGAFTFYDSVPADQNVATRYRDAQVGIQLDHGLRDVAILGPSVLSLAGYFQYQHSPAILDVDPAALASGVSFVDLPEGADAVFATKGNIWLVQAKLSLVPAESSIKIPLSVTWSNRTELIDKPAWRGQVGISYDLDSLFGALTDR